MFKAPASQLIELIAPVNAGPQTPIYFQNQPQLQSVINDRKIYVVAAETFNSSQLSGSPITAGNAVPGNADIINATLTLNVAGTLQFQQIPLSSLVRGFLDGAAAPNVNSHHWDLFGFEDLFQVDWTKSYVQLIGAPTLPLPFSYIFNIYYYWSPNLAQ